VTKTRSKLSAIALDQAHEQQNRKVKDIKGALAFLCPDQEETLLKWSLYSPEFLRLEEEYNAATNPIGSSVEVRKHHNDSAAFQKAFLNNIKKVVAAVESIFNPFASDSSSLRSLRNGLEISQSEKIEKSIRGMKRLGDEQYKDFVQTRLLKPPSDRKPLTDTIHKNSLILPSNCEVLQKNWQGISDREEKVLLQDLQIIASSRPDAVRAALRYVEFDSISSSTKTFSS
jgi:hypothetical protein